MDPELQIALADSLSARLPSGDLTIELVRELDRDLFPKVPTVVNPESVTRPDGTKFGLSFYEPSDGQTDNVVGVLWIHGGGLFLGDAAADDARCQLMADEQRTTVASVDYGLVPEHPYPIPLEDCFLALKLLARRFENVIVIGASAGGCLAAGLALLARDRGDFSIGGLHLYYPMLDDRTGASGESADVPVWNARLNQLGWSAYLDGSSATQYASPSRALDLTNLPPTYIDTGGLDLFFDEDLTFAQRLAADGCEVRLNVIEGAVHAFDIIAPRWIQSIATVERRRLELERDVHRIRRR